MSTFKKIQTADFQKIKQNFNPYIKTIDMHTGGEPLRVVIDGSPKIEAASVLEYRQKMLVQHDDFRKKIR